MIFLIICKTLEARKCDTCGFFNTICLAPVKITEKQVTTKYDKKST